MLFCLLIIQVLLIGGPPGIGKTTLVTVAAKQLGFELVSINSSDVNSVSSLLPIITGVVSCGDCHFRPHSSSSSSNSSSSSSSSSGSSGSGKKPVLLLLDEVDGLAHQAAATTAGDAAAAAGAGEAAAADKETCRKETLIQALVRLLQKKENGKFVVKRSTQIFY